MQEGKDFCFHTWSFGGDIFWPVALFTYTSVNTRNLVQHISPHSVVGMNAIVNMPVSLTVKSDLPHYYLEEETLDGDIR